mmetsp:Transcript_915/g.2703  ORF Transcript_915/g.2703 Transcript_915/m.2703 type:complete len:202 (+) Transcript_915:231-836(+)
MANTAASRTIIAPPSLSSGARSPPRNGSAPLRRAARQPTPRLQARASAHTETTISETADRVATWRALPSAPGSASRTRSSQHTTPTASAMRPSPSAPPGSTRKLTGCQQPATTDATKTNAAGACPKHKSRVPDVSTRRAIAQHLAATRPNMLAIAYRSGQAGTATAAGCSCEDDKGNRGVKLGCVMVVRTLWSGDADCVTA